MPRDAVSRTAHVGTVGTNGLNLLRAKQSEGDEGVPVERRVAPTACIYVNCRQRIKSFKMVFKICIHFE